MSADDNDATVDEPALSWRVVGGGEPTAEEVAALTIALLPSGSTAPRNGGEMSGWSSAALAEGVGGRPAYGATDVRRIRYLRPHPG